MLYSQESGSIRSPINTEAFPLVIGERERAYLVVQTARFFCIYIYLYPALMYAVMFYVMRKLHFPLAKNVMHSPSNNWRSGASQPNHSAGTIFRYMYIRQRLSASLQAITRSCRRSTRAFIAGSTGS